MISTVNVPLEWDAMIGTLAPNGRLHSVSQQHPPSQNPPCGELPPQDCLVHDSHQCPLVYFPAIRGTL